MARILIKVLTAVFILSVMVVGMSKLEVVEAAREQQDVIEILYVMPGGSGDCLSWATACELITALDTAEAGTQIWVAAGTYTPVSETDPTDRTAGFVLQDGFAVYGGFIGTETDLSQRDWENNVTVLSGEIGNHATTADNIIHVVYANGQETTILDGFTITGGNADGGTIWFGTSGGGLICVGGAPTLTNLIITENESQSDGAGMWLFASAPVLTNITFYRNSAVVRGGGMSTSSSNPVLTNVRFIENYAINGAGYHGGGNPILTNVLFKDNIATYGGGMYYTSGAAILRSVTFNDNVAQYYGGGLYNSNSTPNLENCTFYNNAGKEGGAIYNEFSSHPVLTNVTISSNTAYDSNGGGIFNNSSSATLTNSIVWNNSPNGVYGGSSSGNYNILQETDTVSGTNNQNTDPILLILQNGINYQYYQPLGEGSPAIDAGDPSVCPGADQRGYGRPVDGDGNGSELCDIGAYEYGASEVAFTLGTITMGFGSVMVLPDQDTYSYGEVVTLTAIPSAGWHFTEWTADVSSVANPLIFAMVDNTQVRAIFEQDEYTLTVTVVPEECGSVLISPEQETYHYGDLVTLTPVETECPFRGWRGDASGMDNPLTYEIMGDTQITAIFSQLQYIPVWLR